MSCCSNRFYVPPPYGCGSNKLKGWSNLPPVGEHIDHTFNDTQLAKVVAIRMAQGTKRRRSYGINSYKVKRMLQCGPNSWVAVPDPSIDKYWMDTGCGSIDWEAEVYNPILGHAEARRRVIFDQTGRKQGKTDRINKIAEVLHNRMFHFETTNIEVVIKNERGFLEIPPQP